MKEWSIYTSFIEIDLMVKKNQLAQQIEFYTHVSLHVYTCFSYYISNMKYEMWYNFVISSSSNKCKHFLVKLEKSHTLILWIELYSAAFSLFSIENYCFTKRREDKVFKNTARFPYERVYSIIYILMTSFTVLRRYLVNILWNILC